MRRCPTLVLIFYFHTHLFESLLCEIIHRIRAFLCRDCLQSLRAPKKPFSPPPSSPHYRAQILFCGKVWCVKCCFCGARNQHSNCIFLLPVSVLSNGMCMKHYGIVFQGPCIRDLHLYLYHERRALQNSNIITSTSKTKYRLHYHQVLSWDFLLKWNNKGGQCVLLLLIKQQ